MLSKKIHKKSLIVDTHCDTPIRLLYGEDLNVRSDDGHLDFVKMKEGGLDAAFFAIYTPNTMEPDSATRRALQMVARTYDAVDNSNGIASVVTNTKEARKNFEKGILSIFLGMENGLPIQKDLSLLRIFADMGIRYITLTHTGNNEICDSCATKEKRWNGLSPFGIEVVKEMNELGILVDVSHISDDSFYDVIKYSKAPVIASHSCCRAIADHPRNLTDDMIRAIASTGGVVQINFYPAFLNSTFAAEFWPLYDIFEPIEQLWKQDQVKYKTQFEEGKKMLRALKTPSYKEVVDHIDHVVRLVGTQHVGFGSDFDGIDVTPEGLDGVDKMPILTEELFARGYSDKEIKQILGENILRLLD